MTDTERLLSEEFRQLAFQIQEFYKETVPRTPIPRSREFVIFAEGERLIKLLPDATLPWIFRVIHDGRESIASATDATKYIIETNPTPRKLYRVLHNISVAQDWFRRRTEGRQRAAAEILRQQAKWVDKIEDRATLASLKS